MYWIPSLLVVFVAFPYITLSAMEAESWAPTSAAVFRTLQTHLWAWAIFYAESALLVVVWLVASVVGALVSEAWAVIMPCPLLAAAIIIYARLMGRLAWCFSQ